LNTRLSSRPLKDRTKKHHHHHHDNNKKKKPLFLTYLLGGPAATGLLQSIFQHLHVSALDSCLQAIPCFLLSLLDAQHLPGRVHEKLPKYW
jgi:hypothetical protein